MLVQRDKGGELLGQEHRRRCSTDQKLTMVRESLGPGQSVVVLTSRIGTNAEQLFQGRKLPKTEACQRLVLMRPWYRCRS
ncbi:hypothetical protein FGE05_28055 [Pseudomonas sp. ICMP22404]|uniref:transposase n=1 Tax=Pseudomonas sp. ICMP22404 TaxID=2583807 RepID=UPI00111BC9D4|nr:hypothetical protein FGE05_28055 [Pseudomonas sp. ICMP22404]